MGLLEIDAPQDHAVSPIAKFLKVSRDSPIPRLHRACRKGGIGRTKIDRRPQPLGQIGSSHDRLKRGIATAGHEHPATGRQPLRRHACGNLAATGLSVDERRLAIRRRPRLREPFRTA